MSKDKDLQNCIDRMVSQGLAGEKYARKICSEREFGAGVNTPTKSKTCIEQMMDEGRTYEEAKAICKGRDQREIQTYPYRGVAGCGLAW